MSPDSKTEALLFHSHLHREKQRNTDFTSRVPYGSKEKHVTGETAQAFLSNKRYRSFRGTEKKKQLFFLTFSKNIHTPNIKFALPTTFRPQFRGTNYI